jgi:tRNA pseudouridine32 synthase/23S rRNA pseudouridine746 synthase
MNQHLLHFKSDLTKIKIPEQLNNPFGSEIPEIARIAALEFQEYIKLESENWEYDFETKKGKMFGVLVVQNQDKSYHYLGTVSGKLQGKSHCEKFVPSVFDVSIDDFFINKGMTELTDLSGQIKATSTPSEINHLTNKRKQLSLRLQAKLFENYHFSNASGASKNVLEIFSDSSHGNPPAAAGECAAPKLFQFAFHHDLKPIAIAEFWWGKSIKNNERQHLLLYPACKNKCRPILEFMLEDTELYNKA